jgi:S-adenosylmethionine hydrolase
VAVNGLSLFAVRLSLTTLFSIVDDTEGGAGERKANGEWRKAIPMPTICLLTDFGTRDPYVASMKGVLASRCRASIVDLTHEIEAFDVFGAAWFLKTAAPWYSGEEDRPVVFVSVVDPGVGTDRRIVLMVRGHQMFLAPDNGTLSLLEREGAKFWSVENEAHFLPSRSTTFHGRDRFAPVAAALVRGVAPTELGPRIAPETMVSLPYEPPSYEDQSAVGTVVAIDRFGNAITDVVASKLGAITGISARIGSLTVSATAKNYEQVSLEPFLIVGSSGTIEISVAGGSAAEKLQLRRFDRVELRRSEP